MKLAYKKFEFCIPSRMDYVTRTFLRRNNFVRRAITHTAADLPAKEQREAQWKEFKSLFHKFCEVRVTRFDALQKKFKMSTN